MYTDSTFCARISPQWLSELRKLWPNVPWQVVCEFISGQVPTVCLDSGTASPLRLCWVKDVCVFRCNLQYALLAEWPGSFTCHCSDMGVEQTPNKSQHTKLTLEKKIHRRQKKKKKKRKKEVHKEADSWKGRLISKKRNQWIYSPWILTHTHTHTHARIHTRNLSIMTMS